MSERVELDFHGRRLIVETGKVAKQAGGAAWVQYGETVVLVTATASRSPREGIDFFPLTCDYQEKTFSAGRPSRLKNPPGILPAANVFSW